MIVTLSIQIKDKDDIRVKAGDIVFVHPSDHRGLELNIPYFLLKVNFGTDITDLGDAKKLGIPQFSTGALTWPNSEEQYTITKKRRYQISLLKLEVMASANGFGINWNQFPKYTVNYSTLRSYIVQFSNNLIYDKYLGRNLKSSDLANIVNAGK